MTKGLEVWLHHLGDKKEYSLFAFGKHRSYECMGGRIGINRKTGQVDVISIPGRSRKHPNQLPWSAEKQRNYLFNHVVTNPTPKGGGLEEPEGSLSPND